MPRTKKRNFSDRLSHEEKMARVLKYFENHVDKGGGTLTLKQICEGCGMPNNGHSGNAILAVCDQFKNYTVVHRIEINVGGQTRYEIEVSA